MSFTKIMIIYSLFFMAVMAQAKDRSKKITVFMSDVPSELYPPNILTQKNFMIVHCVFQGLVRVNENTEIIGDLAERWTINKESTEYTFYIKEAFFHDGNKVTTEDIARSISSHFWSDSRSIIANYMRNVAYKGKQPIEDGKIAPFITFTDRTITFKLKKAYPPFLHILAIPGFSVFKVSKDYSHPIGSGPMKGAFDFKSKAWRLTRHNKYTSTHFQLDELDIEEKQTYKSALESLSKKEGDFSIGYPLSQIGEVALPDGLMIKETNTMAFHHIFFNMKKKYFKNRDDREIISRYVKSSLYKLSPAYQAPISTFLPVGVLAHDYYQRTIKPVSLGIAKKHLGKITGRTLKIVCRWEYVDDVFVNRLVDSFKDLGFKVEISKVRIGGFVQALKDKNYDVLLGNYFGTLPDPDGFLEQLNPNNPIQYGQMPSEEFFSAIDKIRFTPSKRKRLELYAKEIRKLEDQWYFLPLYRINLPIIYNKNLKVPNSSYRYEAELWKILWESK